MKLKDQEIIMYATLLERSSLAQQIYAQYLSAFAKYIIPIPIRSSVKGQEAILAGQSMMEYMPKSGLAQDYYELIVEVWNKVTKGDVVKVAKRASHSQNMSDRAVEA